MFVVIVPVVNHIAVLSHLVTCSVPFSLLQTKTRLQITPVTPHHPQKIVVILKKTLKDASEVLQDMV